LCAQGIGLRSQALMALLTCAPQAKCLATIALQAEHWAIALNTVIEEPAGLPGRPDHPLLVSPGKVAKRSLQSDEGHAGLIHALAHIELNAVDLALDILWRFPGLPQPFYREWLSVAKDEARHYRLLEDHLNRLGFNYGDFNAHNGLWEMAERTKGDLLARLALVPRTLEARGLDASPLVREKLISINDRAGAAILEVILNDEIRHVAIGNHWYRWLCAQRHLDPHSEFQSLALRYQAPKLRGPFNLPGRRAAGFTEAEIAELSR
jgi:uncharacterized ferritin-like protein (DUF455 family)